MNSYVVTGGCGFIGSHIVEELVKNPENKVFVIDNLSSGSLKNIAGVRNKVEFVEADICNYDLLLELFKDVNYIFHMAAFVSVFDSINDPLKNNLINVTGTLNVLNAAVKNKVKRVVLASSAAVYGNQPVSPNIEDMKLLPESPYAVSKLVKEYYGKVYSDLYKLQVISLRFFNVYGPRQDPTSPYSGVISKFIDNILSGKPPVIFGDGKQSRDFVYVKDIVNACMLSMNEDKFAGGEVFNIATGVSSDLLTLLRHINSILGKDITPVFKEMRQGDIKFSLASIRKAVDIMGYKPLYSLEDGLKLLLPESKA